MGTRTSVCGELGRVGSKSYPRGPLEEEAQVGGKEKAAVGKAKGDGRGLTEVRGQPEDPAEAKGQTL